MYPIILSLNAFDDHHHEFFFSAPSQNREQLEQKKGDSSPYQDQMKRTMAQRKDQKKKIKRLVNESVHSHKK